MRTLITAATLAFFVKLPLPALAQPQGSGAMTKYVIERTVPGAGKLSAAQLQAISHKSLEVLRSMGTKI